MKKKIIKFCFSRNSLTPGTFYWFFFSKPYRKQQKRNKYDASRVKYLRKKKKFDLIENVYNFYKNNKKRGTANHIVLNKELLPKFFSKSYFFGNVFINKHKNFFPEIRVRFKLWQKLKKKLFRQKRKRLNYFRLRKILSSHLNFFIYIKSKNYHGMFKYRPRCFNSTFLGYFIYLYSIFLQMQVKLIKQRLYFFTANPTHKNCHYDSDFIFRKAVWGINLNSSKKITRIGVLDKSTFITESYSFFVNPHKFTYLNILILKSNLNKLRAFKDEEDKTKKERLYTELQQLLIQTHNDAPMEISNVILSYDVLGSHYLISHKKYVLCIAELFKIWLVVYQHTSTMVDFIK